MTESNPRHLQWSDQLRAAGRRVTRQRLAVLSAVDTHPHSAADQLLDYAREELPDLTPQSVYVVLNDLTELDMVRRFEPPQSPALYETRIGDNHHHAICTRCGLVEDVDCAVGHAPCMHPHWGPGQKPMTIQVADVVYQGICQNCLDQEDVTPHETAK